MKRALLVGLLVASAAPAQVVEFYGGDWDWRNALASEKNSIVTSGSWTFDDFDHAGGPITALWANIFYQMRPPAPDSVHYETRGGITRGNGGTLHASGELLDLIFEDTGRSDGFQINERYVYGRTSIAPLPPGRY